MNTHTHGHVWMSMNIFTGTFLTHTLGGIHWNKTVQWWGGKLFCSDSRGKGGSPFFHSLSVLLHIMSCVCIVTRRRCLSVFSVPTRQGYNWMLPVPPSRSPCKTLPQPISSRYSYANGPWTHRGPGGTSVQDNVCECVCGSFTSACLFVSVTIMCNEWVSL